MSAPRTKHACGFTLVELLLALALSAMIAALAYAGIDSGMNAVSALENDVRALADLQRAFNLLEEDLVQLRLRAVDHGIGYREPALRGGEGDGVLLELTRGGLANPLQQPRSELLRVRYVQRGQQLWRQYWYSLDRADALAAPQEVLLVDDMERIQVQFLSAVLLVSQGMEAMLSGDAEYGWVTRWNSDEVQTALTAPLPLAVRITIDSARLGRIRREYELPSS